MNKSEIQKRKNDIARLCDFPDRIHRNCIRINVNNSLEHELEKVRQCYILKMNGMEFITEARFCEGSGGTGCADILVLDLAQVVEVLNGETEEECRGKFKWYPRGLSLVTVKVER